MTKARVVRLTPSAQSRVKIVTSISRLERKLGDVATRADINRIDQALAETANKEMVVAMRAELAVMHGDIKCLTQALVGDPDHPDFIGLNERVRTLNERWATVSRVTWIAVTAAIGGFLSMLYSLLRGL